MKKSQDRKKPPLFLNSFSIVASSTAAIDVFKYIFVSLRFVLKYVSFLAQRHVRRRSLASATRQQLSLCEQDWSIHSRMEYSIFCASTFCLFKTSGSFERLFYYWVHHSTPPPKKNKKKNQNQKKKKKKRKEKQPKP